MHRPRCALVTGAATGMGREIAVSLAAAADTVLVHFRSNRRGAEETARRIKTAGAKSAVLGADLSHEAEARGLVAAAEDVCGHLDILVNNVGPILIKPWDGLTEADWEDMLRGNLFSSYFCLAAALPGMKARRFGRVINIGFSRAEQLAAYPTVLPYAAAKTALLILTRTAAAECRGTGVTINMVSPGLMNRGILPAGATAPRPALGTFADVAAAVRFLVS